MLGRTLSHYRIEEKLGEGGMGVVYRAWDERLNRPVALKVLHSAAPDETRARQVLKHEATALLRLSHPRVGTLLDFDHAEGVDFIVMEYVEGATLERQLTKGPLSQHEAIAIAIQVAEAIEEAHEHGVIHRDLKPGNVMVTSKGQVKVLDFGLAKLTKSPLGTGTTTWLSQSGGDGARLLGTLPYMAPEQILSGTADARSDIFSFGVMLYEMVTGVRPFGGDTAISVGHAILNDPVVPPGKRGAVLEAPLERLILRCLEKDPARRYASASLLLRDLRGLSHPREIRPRRTATMRWILTASAVALVAATVVLVFHADVGDFLHGLTTRRGSLRSVAVLPLANLSGDPQQEFFADGMTDAVICQLARLGALRVISRTSVMRYKGTRVSLEQIARDLHVDAVVEGSVMRSGDAVRINAVLIDAGSDQQLWADDYERKVDDLLALQADVAGAIAREVRGHLSPDERARLASGERATAPPNPAAEDAYLKGSYYASKSSRAMLGISVRFFENATGLDSNYAVAWAGLANSRVLLAAMGSPGSRAEFDAAKLAAERALKLDEGLADAHVALGLAFFYGDWDWKGAERELRRAIELNPSHAQAHRWYSELLSARGRHEDAIAEARHAAELDPLSTPIQINLGVRFYYARRTDEAIQDFRRTVELDPASTSAHYWLALALLREGQTDEAIQECRLVGGPEAIGPLGYAYATSGKRAEAARMLAELSSQASDQRYVSALDLTTICLGLGEKVQALQWLDRAVRERATALTMIQVDPLLDPLRSDPRFAAIARRVGSPT